MSETRIALEMALELGFDLAGVAPLEPPPEAEHFRRWLSAGHHADMAWLARNEERICDPRGILAGGRSLLVVGLGCNREAPRLADGARVARYAAGRDYHNLMGRRLLRLAKALLAEGLIRDWRRVVDAGPLLERSHAAAAGLGFGSKAANLLHRDHGPWLLLGELVLDLELEPSPGPPAGSCGTCRACIDACPTGAIAAEGVIDSRRCISYQTIENRGQVPEELRASFGDWLFGCDICSEVCPWGSGAPGRAELWGTHAGLEREAASWLGVGPEEFAARLEGSPLRRARREGLARNAALVLGNRPSEASRPILIAALEGDPSPLVREAAGWALARGHGRDAGTAGRLERAAAREPDEALRAALGRLAADPPAPA